MMEGDKLRKIKEELENLLSLWQTKKANLIHDTTVSRQQGLSRTTNSSIFEKVVDKGVLNTHTTTTYILAVQEKLKEIDQLLGEGNETSSTRSFLG